MYKNITSHLTPDFVIAARYASCCIIKTYIWKTEHKITQTCKTLIVDEGGNTRCRVYQRRQATGCLIVVFQAIGIGFIRNFETWARGQ